MISFLFCLGISLFAALPHSHTVEINDPLPLDEKVYVRNFTNGVTAYVQENKSPKNSASLSIAVKGEQSYSFTIDSINLEEMDLFFAKCKEKIQTKGGKSCAVIAVGDFAGRSVADLIEKHFSTIRYESLSKEPEAPSQMIGLKIAYEVPRTPLRTMADLKKKWVQALSQHILHCRIQAAVNEKGSISEDAAFLLPQNLFAATIYCPEYRLPEISDVVFQELAKMKEQNVSEEEFSKAQERFLERLYSVQGESHSSLLTSYHENLFSHDIFHPSFAHFIRASIDVLPEISLSEVSECLQTSLKEEKQIVDVAAGSFSLQERVNEAIAPIFLASSQEELVASNDDDEDDEEDEVKKEKWNPLATFKDPFDMLPLSPTERKIIHKIFTNIAKKNVVQLAFEKKSMDRKGKRIHHVHPLKLLGVLFSDPELKACMKQVRKSSFKWNGFLDGLTPRLREEYNKNNLLPYVPGFAKTVNGNPEKITAYLQSRNWEGLVKYLLEI